MKSCYKCGTLCRDDSLYCETCGGFFDEMEENNGNAATQAAQPATEADLEQVKQESNENSNDSKDTNEEPEQKTEAENSASEPADKAEPVAESVTNEAEQEKKETVYASESAKTENANNAQAQNESRNTSARVVRASDIVKRHGSSLMFLFAVIFLCSSILFGVLDALLPYDKTEIDLKSVLEDIKDLVNDYDDIDEDVVGSIDKILESDTFSETLSFGGRTLWSATGGKLFTILIAIGLLMFYLSCRQKNKPFPSTSGLTLIRVLRIITFVLLCLFAIPVILVSVLGIITCFLFKDLILIVGVLFAVAVVLGVFVLLLVYNLKLISSIKSVEKASRNITPNGLFSKFASVFLCIISVFGLIGAFENIVSLISGKNPAFSNSAEKLLQEIPKESINLKNAIESVANLTPTACATLEDVTASVGIFILTLCIFKYRREMDDYLFRPAYYADMY